MTRLGLFLAKLRSGPWSTAQASWFPRSRPSRTPLVYFLLALALAGVTVLLDKLEAYFGLALLMPYVVLVVVAARWGGIGAAIFTSLAALPLVDYFLLGPQGRLELGSRQNLQVVLVLLAGLILGWLVDGLRAARESAEAAAAAERAALEERDALLSVIAHDLSSPLSAVRLRIQLAEQALGRDPADVAGAQRSLGAALPQVDRINRLLDDLLATGRTDGGTLVVQPVKVDLAPLLARVADRWRAEARYNRIEFESDETLSVMGDPGRIEQVLDNLLANAVKYSAVDSEIRLSGRINGDEVHLAVSDQGAGIPPDEQVKLFERFYRRPEHRDARQPGLGLGLYITRELINAQGGRVWVESEVGRGSTFYVALPRHACNPSLPKSA